VRSRQPRTRALGGAALVVLGLVLGVAVFAPKLLVAVVALLVSVSALAVALWMLSQFPNPFR
jgi:hypothetical protein